MRTKDINQTEVIENRFNCPTRLWNKFSTRGRAAYNNVRAVNKSTIIPGIEFDAKVFDTISHNYACFAAWEF